MRDVVPVGFFLLAVAAALPYSAAILAAALYLGWVACCFMKVTGESFVGRQQGFGPVLYWPANGIPVGWWDETQGAWMLNDEFGARLLALLTSLGWGDAKNGQIPNLEILTRP